MSNRDPFEEMLAGLNRPAQPRPEFANALEHRLMAEFGTSESSGKGVSEMLQATATSGTWRNSDEPGSNRRKWLPVIEIAAVVLIAFGIGAAVLGSRGFLPGQSNGSHSAQSIKYPITPDAEDCTVKPRTVEEIEALVPAENYGDFDQLAPSGKQATPPTNLQHSSADEETMREIEAAYVEWVSCLNAGDRLRELALYSDDYLRSGNFYPDDIQRPAEPLPPEERATILDISYVREFDDGRAGGVIVVAPKNFPAAISPFFIIFKKEEGRWLIDGFPMGWATEVGESDVEVIDGEEVELPTTTPAAVVIAQEEPTVVPKPTETPES